MYELYEAGTVNPSPLFIYSVSGSKLISNSRCRPSLRQCTTSYKISVRFSPTQKKTQSRIYYILSRIGMFEAMIKQGTFKHVTNFLVRCPYSYNRTVNYLLSHRYIRTVSKIGIGERDRSARRTGAGENEFVGVVEVHTKYRFSRSLPGVCLRPWSKTERTNRYGCQYDREIQMYINLNSHVQKYAQNE